MRACAIYHILGPLEMGLRGLSRLEGDVSGRMFVARGGNFYMLLLMCHLAERRRPPTHPSSMKT